MVIAFIILSAGVLALKESVERILHPSLSTFLVRDLIIIIFAIAVKITMGLYFRRQGTQWRSSALSAAGIDSLYDAILTFVTLISSLLVYCFSIDIQGYVGAAIGLMIIRAGAGIVHDMYNHLLGVRTDPTLVRRIKERIAHIRR